MNLEIVIVAMKNEVTRKYLARAMVRTLGAERSRRIAETFIKQIETEIAR
jgi:hypothetical protein